MEYFPTFAHVPRKQMVLPFCQQIPLPAHVGEREQHSNTGKHYRSGMHGREHRIRQLFTNLPRKIEEQTMNTPFTCLRQEDSLCLSPAHFVREPKLILKLSVGSGRVRRPTTLHYKIRRSELFIQPGMFSGRCSNQRRVGRQWPLCQRKCHHCALTPPRPLINLLKPQLNEPVQYFCYEDIPVSAQTISS